MTWYGRAASGVLSGALALAQRLLRRGRSCGQARGQGWAPDVSGFVNGTRPYGGRLGGTGRHDERAKRLVRWDLAGRVRTAWDPSWGVVVPKVGGSSPLGHPHLHRRSGPFVPAMRPASPLQVQLGPSWVRPSSGPGGDMSANLHAKAAATRPAAEIGARLRVTCLTRPPQSRSSERSRVRSCLDGPSGRRFRLGR